MHQRQAVVFSLFISQNGGKYGEIRSGILWEINNWRTCDNWHWRNDREEENLFKRLKVRQANERINKHVGWKRVEKGELNRDAPYRSCKSDSSCERWSSPVRSRARVIKRRRHTLDNKRYTRTAFALCLNGVISCLYLPFITTVSFPPPSLLRRGARSARKIVPPLPVIVLHPYIICNWFEPTGYKLSMLHGYVSIRLILTSSV